MMGWHITIYRAGKEEEALAKWQAPATGLNWLQPLLEQGRAEMLEASGYPCRYRILASALLPLLKADPPEARNAWLAAANEVIDFSRWPGKTTLDHEALAKCDPDEWLLLDAWDES
ncbi:MAG: hypothetical protein JNM62_08600 [Flavobacteriales bacterium]|nr:hypothetical protein [Flavobacteriales bacterium]